MGGFRRHPRGDLANQHFIRPAQLGERALLRHALKLAAEGGFRTLVVQGDPNAERFYRANGGELVGQRESDSIPGRMLPVFHFAVPRQG